jgi:hypothetical protein
MTTRIAYESPLVTLWEGDCAEVIADLPAYSQERPSAFHLLATDPPYGVGWQSNARIKSFDRIAGDDGTLDVPSILGAAVRALPLNRHVYVFGYTPDQLAAPMALSSTAELVWDKILPSKGDLTLPYATSFERLTFGVHGKGWKSTMTGGGLTARMRRGAVLRVPRPNGRAVTRHPTEKPVALMRQLMTDPAKQPCEVHRYHSPKPLVIVKHHLVPLSCGGWDTRDNYVYVCDRPSVCTT